MALLADLFDDPLKGYLGLEGHVNSGSPSGYSELNVPLGSWDPVRGEGLPVHVVHWDGEVTEFGTWPLSGVTALDRQTLLAHPLMVASRGLDVVASLNGAPTASSRTVVLTDSCPTVHAKLHYPGVLGRVRREIPLQKAIAGYEVSSEVANLVGKAHGSSWGVLREIGGRSAHDEALGSSWSVVLREGSPHPEVGGPYILIPGFSLTAVDPRRVGDPLLLAQLFQHSEQDDPTQWLLSSILAPLIEFYMALVGGLGLMPEINAQNWLLQVFLDGSLRVVLRDMGRVEKLLHLRRREQLNESFLSSPYKEVDANFDPALAAVRHSFSFDFKLSQYVLMPLISTAVVSLGVQEREIVGLVRELVGHLLSKYDLIDFFPPCRVSYGHPKMMLTESRPYIDLGPAFFR